MRLEMENLKRVIGEGAVLYLPESLIQHIQSFLTCKEAAQTAILSKSWHTAWLTSTLDIDQKSLVQNYLDDQLREIAFAEFATKKMQRYQDLNLKIDRFRLRTIDSSESLELLTKELIVKAMQMGATDINLEFNVDSYYLLTLLPVLPLPREVFKSESLVRLSVTGRKIDGNLGFLKLKSLTLNRVYLKNGTNIFRDIVSSCVLLEELSLSHGNWSSTIPGYSYCLPSKDRNELPNLRRLFLESVNISASFFRDFASKFACLKDLSLVRCHCYTYPSLKISSTSLEKVRFVEIRPLELELEVPNLVEFNYSGETVPESLSIKSSRRWESYLSIKRTSRPRFSRACFLQLNMLLKQLSPSKISFSFIINE